MKTPVNKKARSIVGMLKLAALAMACSIVLLFIARYLTFGLVPAILDLMAFVGITISFALVICGFILGPHKS
jgi:hypothetical protein